MSNLTLDIYAKLLARLACCRGARLEEILTELGIDADTFGHAEAALRAELRGAWPNRKGIGAMKFATALGTELERLGALASDNRSANGLAGDARQPPLSADARPREPEVPSFLQAPPPPMPIAPVAPIAPLPVAAPADPPPASKSNITGTVDMDLSAIVAAVKRGEIPFKPSEGPPANVAADAPPRPPAELPAKSPHAGGTMNADLSAVVASVRQGALPFNSSEGSGLSSARGPSVDIEPEELPLETYASVTGALARGESREEALARHGLRADAFDRLAKAWAQRFQREPHLLARFQELARSNAGAPRRTE